MRSALWYSLGWTSLGLQDGKRPARFGVPYKLCQGEGLNLDWLPLVVWRAARAEGASQGLEWQCYVNGYLLSLGCKGESGPSSESCLVLGGGSRALLSTTRVLLSTSDTAAGDKWISLCLGPTSNTRSSSGRFGRVQTNCNTFFFCPRISGLKNLLPLEGGLDISLPWNAPPRVHRTEEFSKFSCQSTFCASTFLFFSPVKWRNCISLCKATMDKLTYLYM